MAQDTADGVPDVSEFDLLPQLVLRLDRHLIFPLVDFAASQVEEDDEAKAREMTKVKYDLFKKTNMTDYVAKLYCEIEDLDTVPADFAESRKKVLAKMEQLETETSTLRDLLENEDVVGNLRSDKVANLEFLKKEHGVSCLLQFLPHFLFSSSSSLSLVFADLLGHCRNGQCPLRLWKLSVQLRQLRRRRRTALSVSCAVHR